MIDSTLCFILDKDGRCLMQRRCRPPHRGQWNAPGGKVQEGETPTQACRREVKEETGLSVQVQAMGRLDTLDVVTGQAWRLYMFLSRQAQVTPVAGGEGELAWLPLGEILSGGWEVVHNIPLVLPLLLQGVAVQGKFYYRDDYLERYDISLTSRGRGMPIS